MSFLMSRYVGLPMWQLSQGSGLKPEDNEPLRPPELMSNSTRTLKTMKTVTATRIRFTPQHWNKLSCFLSGPMTIMLGDSRGRSHEGSGVSSPVQHASAVLSLAKMNLSSRTSKDLTRFHVGVFARFIFTVPSSG